MIAEQAEGIYLTHEGNASSTVRAAIDEVSELDDFVFGTRVQGIQKLFQLLVAPMNISNRNKTWHKIGDNVIADGLCLRKQKTSWIGKSARFLANLL